MVKSGLEIVGTVFGVAALIISRLSDRRTRTGIVGAGTVNPGRWGSCHGVWSAVGASKTTAYVARSRCDFEPERASNFQHIDPKLPTKPLRPGDGGARGDALSLRPDCCYQDSGRNLQGGNFVGNCPDQALLKWAAV